MVHLYLVPNWFFGYDIIMEFVFALITLAVSFYAFKVHKLVKERQTKLFGISFLLISLSYFAQAFLNLALFHELTEHTGLMIELNSVSLLHNLSIYAHVVLFICGLITLTYMTLKIKSPKTYFLLLIMPLIALLFSMNTLNLFYILASLLLIYISFHYLLNYIRNKHTKNFMVLLAFILIFLGNVHFIFSVNHGLFYVIGHVLELLAYILILINLILVVKK